MVMGIPVPWTAAASGAVTRATCTPYAAHVPASAAPWVTTGSADGHVVDVTKLSTVVTSCSALGRAGGLLANWLERLEGLDVRCNHFFDS
jgi:hypothetical protein